MEYQNALNVMCNRCVNHEICQGTGCSPKQKLQELVTKASKTVPMKVLETNSSFVCRQCCTIISMKYDGVCIECLKQREFCPVCGQAIDWSDVGKSETDG